MQAAAKAGRGLTQQVCDRLEQNAKIVGLGQKDPGPSCKGGRLVSGQTAGSNNNQVGLAVLEVLNQPEFDS